MPTLLRRLISPRPRTIERDTVATRLPDGREITVTRVRDPRARRIKLTVPESGPRLTLPLRASLRAGQAFLDANLGWLADQLVRQAALTPVRPPLAPGDPGPLPLRGVHHRLEWRDGLFARAERIDDAIAITLPPGAKNELMRRLLRDLYLAEARADVGRWLPKYLPTLPRAPRAVKLAPLASLWGSLSPSDGLSLDLALVLGPPAAFEYVLVHELCHLIHANHSRAFWREVEARFPAWRDQRAFFNTEGLALKAELRRLLGP